MDYPLAIEILEGWLEGKSSEPVEVREAVEVLLRICIRAETRKMSLKPDLSREFDFTSSDDPNKNESVDTEVATLEQLAKVTFIIAKHDLEDHHCNKSHGALVAIAHRLRALSRPN